MHLVVFGLSMSSSWGNGHATLWRGLVKALVRRGHTVRFYEKETSYYATTRDGWKTPNGATLCIYETLQDIATEIKAELRHADLAMTTSYCPDGVAAAQLIFESSATIKAFYDLDTPITLDAFRSGEHVPYLPSEGLAAFDLVLSYTGGRALAALQNELGARDVAPLYGWVDPEVHQPAATIGDFRSDLSYLGTFAKDRQDSLNRLFVRPAHHRPDLRFALGGAQYPDDFPWTPNICFVRHLPPSLHAAFFCSSRMTLNVTRQAMARYGFCPSGRLFEAAACGAPLLSDRWEGLDTFFSIGEEIIPVETTEDVVAALSLSDRELFHIAAAARARVLECHTAAQRAIELEAICDAVRSHSVGRAVLA